MPQGAGVRTTVPNPNSLKASTPPHSGAWRKAAIAFANTGRIRPSEAVLLPCRTREIDVCDFIEDCLGANHGEMVIDSFTLGHVPFQEADERATAAQVRAEDGAGDADRFLADRIGIVGNNT